MDGLDRDIIHLLQRDGRASNAKIAREMSVSEGTVRRRLKRLVEDDVINVIAVPSMEKMGYGMAALVGVQTDPGSADDIAEKVGLFTEVHYVAVTTGSFDIFLWVSLTSAEHLGSFLKNQVGVIPGVRRTETFVNLSTKKKADGLVL